MTDAVSDPATLARDPVALTRALIRCPSVTPAEGGALEFLETVLGSLGFTCHRLRFEEPGTEPVENLYARLGTAGPNFAFAGHTDVVPPGKREGWTVDPFAGEIMGGRLFGRGAVDMKGAVAAFVAAAARHIDSTQRENGGTPKGSISLIITGDEEGVAINGTRKVLEWMVANGETVDACVVGEPTNPKALGDMIKIGRRGSVTGHITVFGAQGHVAYPHLADNPLPRLVAMLKALTDDKLDEGTAHFQASTLAITTIDVGNPAHNIIPAQGKATFNVRFNDAHSPESLMKRIRDRLDGASGGGAYELEFLVSGDSFVTQPGPLTELVADAVESVTGRRPEHSTTGGTSDARFIKDLCPVVEFGLVGRSMHKVDEYTTVDDLERLTDIYGAILRDVFDRIG